MESKSWPTKDYSVINLYLDEKNPRLGRETTARAPREIIQYLFDNDKAYDVAESIAVRGFFPNEPLLAIEENNKLIVIEGNRRLAALKALKEPGLLEGSFQRKVEKLSKGLPDLSLISRVPVTIAPNREVTDVQLAGRHRGTPVRPWTAENRASFILDKLSEGYSNDQLRDVLGFSLADIQQARQTRATADMARSIELPDEVKAKLENPRAKIFTTIERVLSSSAGRKFLMIEPSSDHGIKGTTTRAEFVKGFTKLVTDVALSKVSSRSLNTIEDMQKYFDNWESEDVPMKKKGSFVPADIITNKSVASSPVVERRVPPKVSIENKMVLPRDFKVRYGSERLKEIRAELVKLKREDFPNAGAVLLRVFFELAVTDYLTRTGDYSDIIKKLKEKDIKLFHGKPNLKQLLQEIPRLVKAKLTDAECNRVFKAIKYDPHAPFSITELHGFVHTNDFPTGKEIYQFWSRTEPLFRMMLENDVELTGS